MEGKQGVGTGGSLGQGRWPWREGSCLASQPLPNFPFLVDDVCSQMISLESSVFLSLESTGLET